MALQFAVRGIPALQQAFGTVALDARDWLRCMVVASSVLWIREATKLIARTGG